MAGFFLDLRASTQITNLNTGALFLWLPILSCTITLMILWLVSDNENSVALTSAIVAIFVSVLTGVILQRYYKRTLERLVLTQKESVAHDDSFYTQIFPVWSRQISTSRNVGDQAVEKLSILFGEIVSKLEAVLNISKHYAHAKTSRSQEKGFLDVVNNSQTDIQSVFVELKAALGIVNDNKDMLLAEITMYSVRMKEMADEGNLVAFQSQIIALNAEIEAARAGETGRAFGAVVSEMRQLARQSSETSKKMTLQVKAIDSAMIRFYSQDKETALKESQQLSSAEQMLNEIIKRFNKMSLKMEDSIDSMALESQHIRDDISSALVQLQFQDRTSQIMAHVADNINVLNELTEAGDKNLDANAWLNEMEKQFSVDEERGNLGDKQKTEIQTGGLTFF